MDSALFAILVVLAFSLGGAGCQSDAPIPPRASDPVLDDADDSPIAGSVPGSFAISSTGEATYSIPLVVPPGAAGMQPSLAITYSSASGDGVLGMGFSLTGLSAITRCAKTMAQDGRIRGVRYDAEDALCLDGARLVPVGKSNGATEYRTFPNTFAKILAFPSENPANPAETWKVFTRSGTILEYGSTPDTQVMGKTGTVRAWLVSTARDRSGNTIDYQYANTHAEDGHTVQHAPVLLRYTGNGSVLPSQRVELRYEPKATSARRLRFTGGMNVESTEQLAAIAMRRADGVLVREYRFAFTTGVGSGRTLLRNIRECADDGSCKPRTTFRWHGEKPGFARIPTPIEVPRSRLAAPMMLDVTGDGLDDLVVPTVPWDAAAHSEIPTTDWTIAANLGLLAGSASPFFQAPALAYSEEHGDAKNDPVLQREPDLTVQPDYGTPIDYNQDGRSDILVHNVHATAFKASTTWQVLLAREDRTFAPHDTGIPRPKHLIDGAYRLGNREASAHLADVNGDGIADLVQCERDESAGGGDLFTWTLRRWTPEGPGFEVTPRPIPALVLFHCGWDIRPVDLDADGRVDLVYPDLSQNQNVPLLAHRTLRYDEASDTWETEAIGTLYPSRGTPLFLDVNGDGLPDIVKLDAMTGQPVAVLNTGDTEGHRFDREIPGVNGFVPGDLTELWGLAAVIDLDGDGRQDILVPRKDEDGLTSWVVLRSRGADGEAPFTLEEVAIPFDAELSQQGATISNRMGPRITDVDGDGAPDVVLPIGTTFSVFRSLGAQHDLLASVHDGLNAHDPDDPEHVPTLQVDYGTLIDRTITEGLPATSVDDDADYVSHGSLAPPCVYPIRCVVGARPVVRGYDVNSGADVLRHFRVQYRDGRYDRRGRGFLGFHVTITSEPAIASGTIAVYEGPIKVDLGAVVTYPEAGQLHEEIRWTFDPRPEDPSRIELSFATFARELRVTDGGATYFLPTTSTTHTRAQGHVGSASAHSLYAWLQMDAKMEAAYLGGSSTVTPSFDDYGNSLGSVTTAKEVDLTTTIADVKYDNDPSTWLIGLLTHRTECSSAAGVTQCRILVRTYDPVTGLLTDETRDADGDPTQHLVVTFARDTFGNVTTTTAEDGLGNKRVSSTSYEPSGTFPSLLTNALGHTLTPTFDPGLGVMLSMVDENQLTTAWRYDRFGRQTREQRPDGTVTVRTIHRRKDGGPKRNAWQVRVRTTTTGGGDTLVELDGRGRPIRGWTHAPQTGTTPPPRIVQEVEYDARGEQITRRTLPVRDTVPPESRYHEDTIYDPLGRVRSHTTPWKATTTYSYPGRDVVITDPLQNVTIETHDPLGRLVSVTAPEGGSVTSYTYGPFGALATVTDPDLAVTTTMRDAFGRVRTQIDPDRGTTILDYDGFGDVASSHDAAGRTSVFTYDALGRKIRREDMDGLPNSPIQVTTWTWDTAPLGSGGALAAGLLAAVEAPDGTTIATHYDDLGRIVTTELHLEGERFDTAVRYNLFGRVEAVTYPSAEGLSPFTIENDYDPHGNLIEVAAISSGTKKQEPYWKLTGIDDAGRIAAELFGNGFTTKRTYFDDKRALASIHTDKDGAPPVQALAYEYDEKRNLVLRHDALQIEHPTERFAYDALDRLTCATFSNAPTCPDADRYTYTPNGNLRTKPGIAGTYAYDPAHPHAVLAAGADAFGYDLVGNQIARSGASVTYTAFDLPKTFTPAPGKGGTPVTLDYDGDQRRVRKTAGDEVTVYVGGLYERTTNTSTGSVEHRYFVHGPERAVAVVMRTLAGSSADKTRYLHVDHLGSVETVTDESGDKAIEKRSYDAFGARRNPQWGAAPIAYSSVTTLGFTGHEDDAELGLVNMKGRLYDPKVGRFLTMDPIVSHPRFGQSWNPYSYVLNNPLSFVDPSGFEPALLQTEMSAPCSGCPHGLQVASEYTSVWIGPSPPPAPPPPPNLDASLAGLMLMQVDMKPTGNAQSPRPEAPADGAGGGVPDLNRSAGLGGWHSGEIAHDQQTPTDVVETRRNLNELGYQLAVTAVLAPMRYPVVVGVIAFGVLSPDPAYAPTVSTVPEDRPSTLSRVGEVGLAAAIGAAGIKIGQWATVESEFKYHLNTNTATSNFGIYEIEVNGQLYKIGKADLNRVTRSSGLPTRVHQQRRSLQRVYGKGNVNADVVEVLGVVTTGEAKAAETARIVEYFKQTGLIPLGNQKSFKP